MQRRTIWGQLRRFAPTRLVVVAGVVAGLAALTVPPAPAGEPGAAPFVAIRIDTVTPDLVTTTSAPVVTVTGRVSNVGDRPVRDVMVRLEHSAAVRSSAGLRTTLHGEHDQYQPVAEFETVATELDRGQDVGFRLSAPLRSPTESSLTIEEPGIYPLLVNVNATPDYGVPARLDDARFLMPVLGVPPGDTDPDADSATAAVAPDTTDPVQLTMLWPLADRPRLAPGTPGGTVPVRLSDDELATSLAAGGRLDTLLSAVEFATRARVDPDGAVGRSLCLAVDPDLLVTVNAMTAGYVVGAAGGTAPSQTREGTGQLAATNWLERLRRLAERLCVTAIPYAQADLGALHRVGDPGLAAIATDGAGEIVNQILGVASVRGATPLGDGALTRPVVDLLTRQSDTVAVAAAQLTAGDDGAPATADLTPQRLSPRVVVAPFDPAVGAALAAAGTQPVVPTYLDTPLNLQLKGGDVRHDSVTARRQDALGSMLWRALAPEVAPRTEILLPPASWALQPEDAQAILSVLATTIRSGLAVPRPMPTLIAQSQAVAPAPAAGYPAGAHSPERGRFDDAVTAQIADQTARLWGLTSALTTDPRTGLTGIGYTAPLREDMLRALSQAEPPGTRNGLARRRLGIVGDTIEDLIGGVTIVNPGGSYTMATEHSPLPLALRNDLAVPIRVRLHVDAPPGMTVTDTGEIELPPGYLPLRVPIEVRLNQRVAVDVALRTPEGMPLGESVRLSVHANAYGKVLFAITLSAAAVLVLLTGRRLWHRFRGQPDRADLDRPSGGAHRGAGEPPP